VGEKAIDIALGILQASIALAGLILVYSGFLIAKAAEFQGSTTGDTFLKLARWGLVPVIFGFATAVVSERVLVAGAWGGIWANNHLLPMFVILLAISVIYAIIAAFAGT
jgi:hypothetical protein